MMLYMTVIVLYMTVIWLYYTEFVLGVWLVHPAHSVGTEAVLDLISGMFIISYSQFGSDHFQLDVRTSLPSRANPHSSYLVSRPHGTLDVTRT